MKKKGFSFIETIMTLFIIAILFSGTVSLGNFECKIYKNIESEGFLYEMHNFLTYAKLKSKFDNQYGKLLIIPSENKIYYTYNNLENAKDLIVPNSIKITSGIASMPIDSSGRINKSDTIKFQNSFDELKDVRIRVGVDYINLNDDE